MRRLLRALLPLGVLLALPGPAAADETLAQTTFITDISAGSGTVLYSAYDPSIKRYRLMRIVDGQAAEAVPVKPSRSQFQADVGPTASGHVLYVYVRCTKRAGSCDLFTFNPVTGKEQRSKASDPKHSEGLPTYWKGRLAFVRSYGPRRSEVVYQRPNARTRHSRRVAGVPRRRCDQGACIDPATEYNHLELHGRFLAQSAFADFISVYDDEPVKNLDRYRNEGIELRLADLRTGRSKLLAAKGRGEGAQEWSGLAIDRGALFAAFTCFGDTGGCAKPGILRFTLAGGAFAFSRRESPLNALAVAGGRTYELRDAEFEGVEASVTDDGVVVPGDDSSSCDGNDTEPAETLRCRLIRRDPPPVFRKVPSPSRAGLR